MIYKENMKNWAIRIGIGIKCKFLALVQAHMIIKVVEVEVHQINREIPSNYYTSELRKKLLSCLRYRFEFSLHYLRF